LPSQTGLQVSDELWLPETELNFSADRSGGPGGQHVNKVSTRVSLVFDVAASPTLSELQKDRIRARLAGRISQAGLLRVSCRRFRSQHANRQAARERLRELLAWALAETPERLPTRPPAAARRRRLEEKSRLSRRKAERARTLRLEDEG
jgi:ribosome-associated protein